MIKLYSRTPPKLSRAEALDMATMAPLSDFFQKRQRRFDHAHGGQNFDLETGAPGALIRTLRIGQGADIGHDNAHTAELVRAGFNPLSKRVGLPCVDDTPACLNAGGFEIRNGLLQLRLADGARIASEILWP